MSSIMRTASEAIPSRLKPPLLVFLNLAFTIGLSYLANPWIGQDVTAIQRPMTELSDYTGLVGWRIVECLCYWMGGWDATHAAYLMTLSLAPALHYSHTYQPSHAPLLPTLTVAALVDAVSIYLPLRFLRIPPKSVTPTPPKPEPQATRLLTALLSSSIYQLVLYSAAKKFLTTWLLTCGWDLESVERVHDASEAVLLARALMMMPVGWAVSNIISYSPSLSLESTIPTEPASGNSEPRDYSGIWGFIVGLWIKKLSPRTRKIVKRTLLIAGYQSVSSAVGLAGTVKGGNMAGAAGISGVWTAATMAVGIVLYWVGKV